ncbi:unnamed protein product [Cyclocybe aegerita]|uniref:Uncharacterized protein n=1 Tax=Cyclocybe aegerita TaxID=1973307 RepID=A0A8S0WTC4_CYCAE|nr:unnamed protein product [Cyclocybe aegerita]
MPIFLIFMKYQIIRSSYTGIIVQPLPPAPLTPQPPACPPHPLPLAPTNSLQERQMMPNMEVQHSPPASCLLPPPPPPLTPLTPSGGVQMKAVVKEEGAQRISQVPHPQVPSHWCTNGPKLQHSGLFGLVLTLPPTWFTPPSPPRPPHPLLLRLAIRHPQGLSNNAPGAQTIHPTTTPLPSTAPSHHPTPPGAIQQHPWCMNDPEQHLSGLFAFILALLPAWFIPPPHARPPCPPPPLLAHPTPQGPSNDAPSARTSLAFTVVLCPTCPFSPFPPPS